MKVLYTPLDERPCNYDYPQLISGINADIEVLSPSKNILGFKKKAANIVEIQKWILNNVKDVDGVVLSNEMITYGGLLPSRLHQLTLKECLENLAFVEKIKDNNPKIKIYMSSLIMRTPQYNSDDEEPHYYQDYGYGIFKRAYLKDKKERDGITETEQVELDKYNEEIPEEFYLDYENRRKTNIQVLEKVIEYVNEGVIDFLSIPQDDSSPYGYTAIDQKRIVKKVKSLRLYNKVHMYPGADEVGNTLISRMYNELNNLTPKFYVMYSSTLGPSIIPKYEDRPSYESIKSHIHAIGGIITQNIDESDLVLAVNSPGKFMQESSEQYSGMDITYHSFRNLRTFVNDIKHLIEIGKKVIIADVAFVNGADEELIIMLDENKILDKLHGYAGWNTHCNTVGTTLFMGCMVQSDNINERNLRKHVYFRVLEDLLYQSIVRRDVSNNDLAKYNANYFDITSNEDEICELIKNKMVNKLTEIIIYSFKEDNFELVNLYSPWHRMFEIGIEVE